MFAGTDVPACEGCEEGGEARHEEQVVGGVVGEAEHGGGQQHDHHHRDAVQGLQGEISVRILILYTTLLH